MNDTYCVHFNLKLIEFTHNEICYINSITLWHMWEIQIAVFKLFVTGIAK